MGRFKFIKYVLTVFLLSSIASLSVFCFHTLDKSKILILDEEADLSEKQVGEMIAGLNKVLFTEMNPREAFRKYFYFGKSNKEFDNFSGLFDVSEKRIPSNLKSRYLQLHFEKYFYELYFVLGKQNFSDDFKELNFDNTDFTVIENKEYGDLLSSHLQSKNISKTDFINFFKEDNKPITRKQILDMEKAFDELLVTIKQSINKEIYEKNVERVNKNWKIEEQSKVGKEIFFLVTSKPSFMFIAGSKNNSTLIVGIPDLLY